MLEKPRHNLHADLLWGHFVTGECRTTNYPFLELPFRQRRLPTRGS